MRFGVLLFLVLTSCATVRAPLTALEDAIGHPNSAPRMAAQRRAEYYASFVGKPAQAMLDEFGPPSESVAAPTGGAYATYYIPVQPGLTRKVVFDISQDETITRVNYWPK